ncbi:unnamed protein product [Brachionus calyciflorus]|uniref:FLYWCH-type domain-containing protein n=1 Tax=Brachionus calyciflorus TaxID=104777 RepID=A0A814DWR2_9BILA|nr:unnamed protein product [Brachionus calyciflorus]
MDNYTTDNSFIVCMIRLIKPSDTSGITDDFGLLVEKLCISISVPEEVQNPDTVFADFDLSFLESNSKPVDLIADKIWGLKINNTEHDWSLYNSQKNNIYKFYSNGYNNVVGKPKRELKSKASKKYWRCGCYNEFGGRSVSNGIIHPFKETKKHNCWHKPKPELQEFMESKKSLNEIVKKSNEPPRTLIREF